MNPSHFRVVGLQCINFLGLNNMFNDEVQHLGLEVLPVAFGSHDSPSSIHLPIYAEKKM